MKVSSAFSSLLGLVALTGCVFSPSFSGPKFDRKKGVLLMPPEAEVVLALTNAKLIRGKRKGFDQSSKDIFTSLDKNKGYLGGAVRVEIFGDEVWTMTVWENQESLERFVNSTQHLNAMYMTNEAMSHFRSLNIKVRAHQIPLSWDHAKKLLEQKIYKEHKPF